MRVAMAVRGIVALTLLSGLLSAPAHAQDPAATATATPSAIATAIATATATPTPAATAAPPTPTATPAPEEPATPAPVEPPAAGEQTPAPAGTAAPPAEPTAAPSTTVATPETRHATVPSRRRAKALSRDRATARSHRRAEPPNRKSGLGSIGPRARSRPKTRTPALAPTPRAGSVPKRATTAPASLGPVRVRVPNFFIDRFEIPPFLLPVYQAAGTQYGIRWEILAAINEIETDYGRNLNVSSAGAVGWMQFMPATWKHYGVDANRDGTKDPYNPIDAIFAAARYLSAAGADRDLRGAIFAYNHADWYVDDVLRRARMVAGIPADLVSSLTGLTQGHFPIRSRSRYTRRSEQRAGRRGSHLYARAGAPVIAVADGRLRKVGRTRRLGNFVQLQDVYGNIYTYAHLERVARTYPVAKRRTLPGRPTSDRQPLRGAGPPGAPAKQRLFANPARPDAHTAGGALQLRAAVVQSRARAAARAGRLRAGARVTAGTVLGWVGRARTGRGPYLRFEIRPAGPRAPRIDPVPILDGWKLLESTGIYRARRHSQLVGRDQRSPSVGEIMLMSKGVLAQRVLANPRINVYACGRRDIEAGRVDRRVLATLEFLAASDLAPTVSSLKCGHSYLTASGNVSEHSSGNAVDIAAVNGTPILGHQGAGSIADLTIQRLLSFQGTMRAHQIISLMTFDGADNTYAMADHHDHIHVGFRPRFSVNATITAKLRPRQWTHLLERLAAIGNPSVPRTLSAGAADHSEKRSSAARTQSAKRLRGASYRNSDREPEATLPRPFRIRSADAQSRGTG